MIALINDSEFVVFVIADYYVIVELVDGFMIVVI